MHYVCRLFRNYFAQQNFTPHSCEKVINLNINICQELMIVKLKTPFMENMLFIVLSYVSFSLVLVLFWMAAAEFYSKEQVGIASSILSSLFLIELISRLGMDNSIVRFFPKKNKCRVFNTSIVLAPSVALLLSLTYLLLFNFSNYGKTELPDLIKYIIYALIPVVISFHVMLGTSLWAIHKAEFSLFLNLSRCLCVLFLIPFLALGVDGIISAFFVSSLLVLLMAILLAKRLGFRFFFELDTVFLKDAYKFSIGNYMSTLLSLSLYLVLPILVMSMFGATDTAHFTIAFSTCTLLFNVPASMAISFFVAGSCETDLKYLLIKTTKIIAITLVILSAIFYLGSYQLLELIGRDQFDETYLDRLDLFRIFIISSFFVAAKSIYFSLKMIQDNIPELVMMSVLTTFLTIIFCLVFMHIFGLIGVGYGWLTGHGLCFVLICIMICREFYFDDKNNKIRCKLSH